MKKTIQIFILVLFLQQIIKAQQIYFCQNYTEAGEPIGASTTWSINPEGGYVNILLTSTKPLTDNLYYLFLDKEMRNKFEPFDSKVINHNGTDKFIAYQYVFKEKGNYNIYFINSQQKKIALNRITIKINKVNSPERRNFSGLYYSNSIISACERVIAGKPINIRYNTSSEENDGRLYFFIENDKALDTRKIVVDIWKKEEDSQKYSKWIDSKKYKTNPDWKYTFFKYIFNSEGEYKILIYNDKQALIGSTYIVVKD